MPDSGRQIRKTPGTGSPGWFVLFAHQNRHTDHTGSCLFAMKYKLFLKKYEKKLTGIKKCWDFKKG